MPTFAFNYRRQFAKDAEGAKGGRWLAKHAGAIRIQPDPVPATDPPLRVRVRRVSEQSGRTLYSAGGGRPVPTELSQPVDVDALRIEFAAPSYRHERQGGDKLLYRSRPDGVDADGTQWSEEGARKWIGLPMRALTFKIEARRPGETASAAATMGLKLHCTWWRTRWALALFMGSDDARDRGGGLPSRRLKVDGTIDVRTDDGARILPLAASCARLSRENGCELHLVSGERLLVRHTLKAGEDALPTPLLARDRIGAFRSEE